MKYFKNINVLAGLALILLGAGLFTAYFLRTPSRELTRTELAGLLESKTLLEASVKPTPYAGIYLVEGKNKTAGGTLEKVYLTTHLDESQVKNVFNQSGIKVDLPGAGLRGQWVNIVSTLLIAGLVIMLVVYQSRIGKGKTSHIRQRPTVSFKDVAGD